MKQLTVVFDYESIDGGTIAECTFEAIGGTAIMAGPFAESPREVHRPYDDLANKCTGLKKIVLGRGIREIGAYTFSFCTALERITLLSPLTEVDEYAFSDCGAFRGIYCRFAESEWTEPAVAEGNDIFLAAERHFE